MPTNNIAYCENEDCNVILYQIADDNEALNAVQEDKPTNCPGCGRFGRLKG